MDITIRTIYQKFLIFAEKVVKAVKVRPSVFTTEQSGLDSSTTGTNPTKEQSVGHECYAQQHSEHHALKRPYCHAQQRDITVELSDEFQEVLDELIGHVKPLLFRLQKNGAISQTKTLSNLNREYTRFVLKQAQMSLKEGEENSKQSHIYRMSVCLHSLVSSVDVLMQSGLEAAIGKVKKSFSSFQVCTTTLTCSIELCKWSKQVLYVAKAYNQRERIPLYPL